jgi:hypothetical protein
VAKTSNKEPAPPSVVFLSLREKFSQDLERIFELAMQKGQLGAALRAKELLAKERGFFRAQDAKDLCLEDLTELPDHLLEKLMQLCEREEKSDKGHC